MQTNIVRGHYSHEFTNYHFAVSMASINEQLPPRKFPVKRQLLRENFSNQLGVLRETLQGVRGGACRMQRGWQAARASVCIRHIYPDSGRARSLTPPNVSRVRRLLQHARPRTPRVISAAAAHECTYNTAADAKDKHYTHVKYSSPPR